MQAEETRAKEKVAFFKNKVLYCEKTTVLTLLVQLKKNHKSFMSKLKLFSNSSIKLLPRKLNRRLTKYLAKTMSFKKTYHCVYSCARPANRLLESVEIGKWHSPVVENPIAQNSDVL